MLLHKEHYKSALGGCHEDATYSAHSNMWWKRQWFGAVFQSQIIQTMLIMLVFVSGAQW